jgi:hypothetical protein
MEHRVEAHGFIASQGLGIGMLRLADTSVRLYRKRDGTVAVHLRSYLMIRCNGGKGFRLAAYLNQLNCFLTLEGGERVHLHDWAHTDDCMLRMDHMIYDFRASGSVPLDKIRDGVGLLEIEYRLFSHPGQGNADRIELIVPVLARGVSSQRSSPLSPAP